MTCSLKVNIINLTIKLNQKYYKDMTSIVATKPTLIRIMQHSYDT